MISWSREPGQRCSSGVLASWRCDLLACGEWMGWGWDGDGISMMPLRYKWWQSGWFCRLTGWGCGCRWRCYGQLLLAWFFVAGLLLSCVMGVVGWLVVAVHG